MDDVGNQSVCVCVCKRINYFNNKFMVKFLINEKFIHKKNKSLLTPKCSSHLVITSLEITIVTTFV